MSRPRRSGNRATSSAASTRATFASTTERGPEPIGRRTITAGNTAKCRPRRGHDDLIAMFVQYGGMGFPRHHCRRSTASTRVRPTIGGDRKPQTDRVASTVRTRWSNRRGARPGLLTGDSELVHHPRKSSSWETKAERGGRHNTAAVAENLNNVAPFHFLERAKLGLCFVLPDQFIHR